MSWRRLSLLVLAILIGAQIWREMPPVIVPVPPFAWIATLVIIAVAAIPVARNRLGLWLERISGPSATNRTRAAIGIAIASCCYLTFTAHRQDRDFFPKTLDDQSYVIQMHMLAHGKLWMPSHPCADFFDTFHMLAAPKYASAYFPGTAILYTPTIWLGLPAWIGPVIVAGAIIGLVYRIVTEIVDGVAGILACLIVLSSNWFRMLSILVYGQPVALLLGLLMVWAWLRWRGSSKLGWSILIGAFAGFLAITRPADAICYATPIGILMLATSEKHGFPTRASPTARVGNPCIVPLPSSSSSAATLPLLAIQAIQNIGVTGHLTQTPFGLYLDRDQPGANFGFRPFDPNSKPASVVPEKQAYYSQFIMPFIQKHTLGQAGAWFKEHLPQIFDVTLSARVMLLLLPIGLLGLARDPRRWALAITFPLFLLIYFGYPPLVEHYAVPYMPAVAMCAWLTTAPGRFASIHAAHRKLDISRRRFRHPHCVDLDVSRIQRESR